MCVYFNHISFLLARVGWLAALESFCREEELLYIKLIININPICSNNCCTKKKMVVILIKGAVA
jgi:hypothetical protein